MNQQTPPQTVEGNPASASPLRGFGVFIELEKRVRHAASEAELHFLIVNETHDLARYRQAVLWKRTASGSGKIVCASGLATVDPNTPFIAWMERVFAHLATTGAAKLCPLTAGELPKPYDQEWAEWLPAQGLLVPLLSASGECIGLLFLGRDQPWSEAECHLLGYLADSYGHAWAALLDRKTRRWGGQTFSSRKLWGAICIALVMCGLIPVHQSALAPAEVIARDPVVVRAPVEGVVDRFAVQPNQAVREGETLLTLDATRLASQLEVARKSLEVTGAEFRQASQQAFYDQRSKADLALIRGRMGQHAAEVDYVKNLLERIVVRAPRDGLAIFDDVNNWIGRPVTIGERILLVADPQAIELEIFMPVADAIALEMGSPVRLFLNIDPHRSVAAQLRYASYQATTTPEGILAYRLVATFATETPLLRIGLKGTAKVYGQRTILAAHLLRRPLAAVRQHLGW